jgi:hypothetical protein
MSDRRSELGDDGTWTIPGARTKNHRPPAVLRIEGDLIFSTTGTSPVSGWSKIKRALEYRIRDKGNDFSPIKPTLRGG